MTTGRTFYDWGGKPAIVQDGAARVVPAISGAWAEADWALVTKQGLSTGRDAFDERFAAWGLPDLDGWYQRPDPARPHDSYMKVRLYASR